MLAWTAAMTAPSTSGASLTRTTGPFVPVELLERELKAEGRAAEIEQDERRRLRRASRVDRIAAAIRGALVPRRPSSGAAGRSPRGTSAPATWATMSRRPSTSVRAVRDEDETDQACLLSVTIG